MPVGCFGSTQADDQSEPAIRDSKSHAYVLKKLESIKPCPLNQDELVINLSCIDVSGLDAIQEETEPGRQGSAGTPHAVSSSSARYPSRGFCKVESMRRAPPGAPPGLAWSNSRRALQVLVDREEAHSRTSQGCSLSHRQRLAERLDRLNLQVYEMAGDGNCQFRSISHELFGTQEHHGHVRKKVMAYIRSHPDEFSCFLGEDFEDYVNAMSRDRCWGDELTLRAACEAYSVIMHVVSSDETNWHLVYKPQGGIKCNVEVFVTYIAPIHYNAIRRKPSLKTMHEKLGNSFKRMSSGRSSGISEDG